MLHPPQLHDAGRRAMDLPGHPAPGYFGRQWGGRWQRCPLPGGKEGAQTYGASQKVASAAQARGPDAHPELLETLSGARGELRVEVGVAPSPPRQRRRRAAGRRHSPGIQQN